MLAGLITEDMDAVSVGVISVFVLANVDAMSLSGVGARLALTVSFAAGPGSASKSSSGVTRIDIGMVFTARSKRSPFTSTVSDTVKVRFGVPTWRGVTCHCQRVGEPGRTGCSDGVVATRS